MLEKDEKEYLKKLAEKDLKSFIEEGKTITGDSKPGFIKGEKEYEEFIRKIIKKLE